MLRQAIEKRDIAKVRELIDDKADVNELSSAVKGMTPTTPLITAASYANTDIINLLLDKGADINKQDDSGETALMMAVRQGYVPTTKLLLEKGADVNIKNKDGKTAIDLTKKEEIKKMIRQKIVQPVGEVVVKKGLPHGFGPVLGRYVLGPKRQGGTTRKKGRKHTRRSRRSRWCGSSRRSSS